MRQLPGAFPAFPRLRRSVGWVTAVVKLTHLTSQEAAVARLAQLSV